MDQAKWVWHRAMPISKQNHSGSGSKAVDLLGFGSLPISLQRQFVFNKVQTPSTPQQSRPPPSFVKTKGRMYEQRISPLMAFFFYPAFKLNFFFLNGIYEARLGLAIHSFFLLFVFNV